MARPRRAARPGRVAASVAAAALLTACASTAHSAPPQASAPQTSAPPSGQLPVMTYPCGIAFGGGYLYYSEVSGRQFQLPRSVIRRISLATGQATVVAGAAAGGQTGEGAPPTQAFIGPSCGLAIDHAGNLLLSDSALVGYKTGDVGRNRVRAIAAANGSFYGQSMQAGHIYTIAGGRHEGDTGDGGPGVAALLSFPSGLAVDRAGNLLIAQDGEVVRLLAARSGTFYGVAAQTGDIYTVTGGQTGTFGNGVPARRAQLGMYPFMDSGHMTADFSLFADARGNLLIADSGNGEVRVVAGSDGSFYGRAMRAGYVYTVATQS